jgi:hypothetical protein
VTALFLAPCSRDLHPPRVPSSPLAPPKEAASAQALPPQLSASFLKRKRGRGRKKVLRLLSFQRWPIQLRRPSPRRRRPRRRLQRAVLTHRRRCCCRPTPPLRRRRLPRPLLQPQRRRQSPERSGFLGRTPPCTRFLAAAKVSFFFVLLSLILQSN